MNIGKRARNGFTLIELLIAIAIVAVIAAILFPVFATVRERGRRTVCQSNLKQIAIAMQQYVQDNDSVYPRGDWAYAPYSYLKNVDIFRCPDATDVTGTFTTDVPITSVDNPPWLRSSPHYPVDYSYNASRLYEFSQGHKRGKQEAVLATPATTFLNMEATWRNPDGSLTDPKGNQFWRTASTSCGQDYLGSILHSGAGNYSYVDGHVKWLTPEEAGEIECANGPLPAPFKD